VCTLTSLIRPLFDGEMDIFVFLWDDFLGQGWGADATVYVHGAREA